MIKIILIIQIIIIIGGPLLLLYFNKRISSYASEVGKIRAISNKIDNVVEQQERITKATEETKSDIAHLAWRQKESQIIKRNKLEEYLEKIFEAVELTREIASEPDKKVVPMTLLARLITLQKLYLPELDAENNKFTKILNDYEFICIDFSQKKIDDTTFRSETKNVFSNLTACYKEITSKSQSIIDKLLDVGVAHNKTPQPTPKRGAAEL